MLLPAFVSFALASLATTSRPLPRQGPQGAASSLDSIMSVFLPDGNMGCPLWGPLSQCCVACRLHITVCFGSVISYPCQGPQALHLKVFVGYPCVDAAC